nr:uncharacterized mitochondrial protein AtMg00810-like [Tanacetum cinerariifolium]
SGEGGREVLPGGFFGWGEHVISWGGLAGKSGTGTESHFWVNSLAAWQKHPQRVIYVFASLETLELAQESREKMRLLKKEIKPANYAKINNLSGVFVPQTTKSMEEIFLSNVSNMVTASKTISIPNEDLSNDATPSVARKFLNEVKSSLMTLQRVVKQNMTLEVHNWSSSAHKEVYRIISHDITPIINQVDARVQNFEIQFLQEAAKFVRDFKSLAKEADESLDKQKSLELEIEQLLKASVSHDIMSIMQNSLVDVPSDLRTELDRTKEKLELCIIKRKKNTLFFGITGIQNVNQSPSGIFINQSKYMHEILKKYGLNTSDIVGSPMDIKDKLDLDQIGTPVDATKYRSMIGALMYLTPSRPDIVHATCVCARYQAYPTKKHLKEVKRIFCYLWGIVNMGLWYMKDSGFELTRFSYADYAECKDTFKSTSGRA